MHTDIIIEDTTLRDGEQTPGLALSKASKVEVFSALADAGVQWIEAGIPASGGSEREFLEELLASNPPSTIVGWSRGIESDVAEVLDLGFGAVHIGLPVSDLLLDASLKRSREWVMDQARHLIGYARDRGAFVSISAEDVGRADRSFLLRYAAAVAEAGADRLRLSDTVGVMRPDGYAEIVREVIACSGAAVQCHCHDDFGLGLTNTLAGLEAGARYCHATINGIGERAGLPDIAQVVACLQILYEVEVPISLPKLQHASRLIEELSGIPVPGPYPIVGRNVARHESGIHVQALLRNEAAFEPVSPDRLGVERSIALGKHSGRAAVRARASALGFELSSEAVERCLAAIRELAVQNGGEVDDAALLSLLKEIGSPG
jgi:homocitrate synthase NifV